MYVARMGIACLVLAVAMPAVVGAQAGWVEPYEKGLAAAKKKDWHAAVTAFQASIAVRAEDTSEVTTFQVGPSRRETWRGGAPYTPNFAVAYATYRIGQETKDNAILLSAVKSLEALRSKSQFSLQLYYVLSECYAAAGDQPKRADTLSEFQAKKMAKELTVRVDTAVMLPDDIAAAAKMGAEEPKGTKPTDVQVQPGAPGVVPYVANKYAILIGVSKYGNSIGDVPYATADCQVLKEALSKFAGYNPEHITVLNEPKLEELQTGVQNFAGKLPADAVVFFFFAGAGRVNSKDEHDYLIPSGSSNRDAFEEFVKKTDLLAMFGGKAERVVAVFEVNRDWEPDKSCYGKEEIQVGATAQINACWNGERCISFTSTRGTVGVWADAAGWVLENKLRGQKIPAEDFCFEVARRVRDVSSSVAHGMVQSPLLPRFWRFSPDGTF